MNTAAPNVFALVDCNNFFVSCERVFQPDIWHKPVAVLSNNDGCIIARSAKVKAMGVRMGAPLHEYRDILKKGGVHIFSSNYQLYGDMSNRVMAILQGAVPEIEVYSVDEAFLKLSSLPPVKHHDEYTHYCQRVRQQIFQWTGIPTSVGIAPTKTLAKVASHMVKKTPGKSVVNLCSPEAQVAALARLEVEDLWGVSHRFGLRLRKLGIGTALELRNANPKFIRKHFGVVGERIALELQGMSCLDLSRAVSKKSIMASRSFGSLIRDKADLREALSNHTARAAEKLRKQGSAAHGFGVFIRTNHLRRQDPQYRGSKMMGFDIAVNDTPTLIKAASQLLDELYRPGFNYKKCGVFLCEFTPEDEQQGHLFAALPDDASRAHSAKLMDCMDDLNQRMGPGTLKFLTQGVKTKQNWQMRSQTRSPRFTTQWSELLEVM